jgi:hypothetical protein
MSRGPRRRYGESANVAEICDEYRDEMLADPALKEVATVMFDL